MDVVAKVLTALAAGPRQFDRLLHLKTPLGPDVLVAEALDGSESLGHGGFRFGLTALSIDAHLDLAALLGQPMLLELQTAESFEQRRPLHGHVTRAERIGSNGGLARYRLVIEPWLSFLDQRVDQFVFQDKSVQEIVEDVFADYAGAGQLVPAWRWDLQAPDVYRKYSLCTQYNESDLQFLHRLLAQEGIHYHFEHEADPASEHFGRHVLVLADHNEAWSELGPVRFHRSDATERADSIQHWSHIRTSRPLVFRRSSWNYRTDTLETVEAGDTSGRFRQVDDATMPYAWPDRATGERLVQRHYEAYRVQGDVVRGAGSWRQLRPGARFELTQHPQGGRFACLQVHHRARNNLGAEVLAQIEQTLGRATLPALPLPDALDPRATAANEAAPTPTADDDHFYQNRFVGIPEDRTYRPPLNAEGGEPLHPKPVVRGSSSAIVVTDGAPLQTDRDHRIKVQFPWQRGSNASQRQPHPTGDDNAPGTDAAWTWVRVSAAWAGDNWGSVLLPRRGQEVLVNFINGDIDRPVVTGAVYNGAGQPDAQHNRIPGGAANATGNAPAWFAGNDHDAVFTGFKSQALSDSQSGSGGYQQLRLDDTPGQGRAQASTTQHDSTLTLGHLKAGRDNLRDGERGFGVELATAASGAVRGGAGLLLSSASGRDQLDADAARARLEQGEQLADSLDQVARQQGADLPGEPERLTSAAALKDLQEALATTANGNAAGPGIGGGEGEVPAWSRPVLLATSPDGIAAVTPADQAWVSGTHTSLDAAKDMQWLSQGEAVIAAGGGIALYSHGSEAPAGKPNQETGIALHAAQGMVSARAHRSSIGVAALTNATIASTQADVRISASKHVLATAAGAYIRLEGGNIELGAPGTIDFKAGKKDWTSPQGAQAPTVKLPSSHLNDEQFLLKDALSGEPMAMVPYRIELEDGTEFRGITGADGRTERTYTGARKQGVRIYLDDE